MFTIYPLALVANHLAMTQTQVYNAFTFKQKCEWLAWTNTVLFQSIFTAAYLMGSSGESLGNFFLGYILCDTAFLPFYNRDALMYAHHVFAMTSMVFFYNFIPHQLDDVSSAVIYLESSNILLGITWLLNRSGYSKTLTIKIVGGLALLVYLTQRAVLFPYHLLFVASAPIRYGMSIFVPLNYYWCWSLVSYYKKIGG